MHSSDDSANYANSEKLNQNTILLDDGNNSRIW